MTENFANDFETTLAENISAEALSLTVVSSTGSPSANFRIRIDSEIMLVTAKAGTGSKEWTVTRAAEAVRGDTVAATHKTGAKVEHILTSASLAALPFDASGAAATEETRAKAAESAVKGEVATEKTRAETAEALKASKTELGTEKTRAEGAESTLTTSVSTEKTRAEAAESTKPTATLDTDGTLAANSNTRVASQKAVKTYSDALKSEIASVDTSTDLDGAEASDTKVASQKAVKAYVDTQPAPIQPQLVLPDIAMQPLVNGVGTMAVNRLIGVLATCRKAGTLDKLSVYVGTKAGKVIVSVYDTGQANSGEYTRLKTSGEVEITKEKEWQPIFEPGLTVTRGQVLLFTVVSNSATLTLGRHGSAAAQPGAGIYPEGYLTGLGSGIGPKLLGRREVGAFEAPSKLTYANLDDSGETIAHALHGHIT